MKTKFTFTTGTIRKTLFIVLFSIVAVVPAFSQYIWPGQQTYSIMEPSDVEFNIEWYDDTEITAVTLYFYDEFDTYQELVLSAPTNYYVDGNILTINQSFIEGISAQPGWNLTFFANFDGGSSYYFDINVVYTTISNIYEDSKDYDLSNPTDVFGTISWIMADEITSVKIGSVTVANTNYHINGNWLFFNESYLNTVLLSAGSSIEFTVNFNSGDSDTFIISAIETGVINPSLSQSEFVLNNFIMPEYIETIITWNSASSVTGINATYLDLGNPQTIPFTEYTVTPINSETAILRIDFGAKKISNAKTTDYYYISMGVIFDSGSTSYIFLDVFSEYYYVGIDQTPWSGGGTIGSGNHDVGEVVNIEAFPYSGYTFKKWIINGSTIVTENPYTFTMPANDLNINALFFSDYPEVLSSLPQDWSGNIDPEATIYLTFDRNIAEGTSNNGFDDITFVENGIDPWIISDIHIENGNMLVIVPATMNNNNNYQLVIPSQSIEDASNPGLSMSQSFYLYFETGLGNYNHGIINPNLNFYSLLSQEDVDFNIIWGEDTDLSNVSCNYTDEFDNYVEVALTYATDYVINADVITINNSFISSLNPVAGDELEFNTYFNSGWYEHFYIIVLETTIPEFLPAALTYDLSSPVNLQTNIVFNSAQSVSSISLGAADLNEGTDYLVNGSWLFINNSYLSNHLVSAGNEIVLSVKFNNDDIVDLPIAAIQSGLTIPTIDPQHGEFGNNSFPEMLDITVTWNDANSISALYLWFYQDGMLESYEYPIFEVIPLNSETALLRIDLNGGGKSTNGLKATYMMQASFEIIFDIDVSVFYYLSIIDEYYEIMSVSAPVYGGETYFDGTYFVGDEVYIEAYPNQGYKFQNWKIDGIVISTQNPYVLNMPANDLLVTANFLPLETVLYTVDISVFPLASGVIYGGGGFTEGEEVTIAAIPNPGYAFENWTDEASAVFATTAEYTFTMPAENLVLTANFIDATDVEQNTFLNQSVYPNPFSDLLIISNPETVKTVIFTNIAGQIVAEHNNLENGQINTSRLANGFYFVILESNDGERLVKKVLKQ